MRIDVLRHGHALATSPDGDAGRALSADGVRAIARLAETLRREGWAPTRAFTSPYRRARETAVLILENHATVPIELFPALVPESDPDALIESLAPWATPDAHLLLVTHQPLAGDFVKRVTSESLSIAPGTLVEIECDAPLRAGKGRATGVWRAPGSGESG